ncbi:MAG: fatty acid oxidation complex subunit alpha FadB [Burkholderiales bacterium]
MFEGSSVQTRALDEGFVEIRFDRAGDAINKLDDSTVGEFRAVVAQIAADPSVRGVLVTSAKSVFIVGADITEFGAKFSQPLDVLVADIARSNEVFVAFEDLAVPSVVAINGYALGGGLELTLAGAMRVMASTAQVGVPEVKLGLFPGFGGTVRLARVAGLATAMDWVASGQPASAEAALAAGVVDALSAPDTLRDAALALLRRCAEGAVDWRARQQRKREVVAQPAQASVEQVEAALERVRRTAPKHQPAAAMAVEMMGRAAGCERADALRLEAETFGRVAQTQAAAALVQTFLNEQALKKLQKCHIGSAKPPARAAVLGAGIMGGGIAYTSAVAGTPVRLKDIAAGPLDLGMTEAARQLARRVKSGRMTQAQADALLATIQPQLDEAGFDAVDIVVEAIVENLELKRRVLAATEAALRPDALIASNTSSLCIADIAAPLARPGNVVGMHFFNPVPSMPLVEIVRGPRSSDAAVATAVAYAAAMRKTPIVVRDGAGFLVNRVLTPYFNAFLELVAEGQDFERIDRAMEAFGWPMGPAFLNDVVGMDTGSHVGDVITAGHPRRMRPIERNAVKLMVQHGRLGQKSGAGFYRHARDAGGRLTKLADPLAHALVAGLRPDAAVTASDAAIVERLMLPMIGEAIEALAENVVGSAAEVDMAMLLGVGFPAYLGGPLKYADWLGAGALLARFDAHAVHGPGYSAPARLRAMAAAGERFHAN